MSWILKIYRNIVPAEARRRYNESLHKLNISYKNKRVMLKKHYGTNNKDKVFYVVRTDSQQHWGIATTCSIVLNNIKYAVERGWIPIIDYQNYYLDGIQDEKNKWKENAWEYYFEQPDAGYSLEEVYQSKNVILGPERGQPYGSLSWSNINNVLDESYKEYFEYAAKYIRIRPDIIRKAEEMRHTVFKQATGKKVLGVGMRAGLYWGEVSKSPKYAHHPKGVDIDEYIALTHKYMKLFACEYIFVSCDDRYYMERMKREFGGKCLYIPDRTLPRYFDDEGRPLSDEEGGLIETDCQSVTERSVDYLVEIYLLAVCDSLIRVEGGGSLLACLFNNRKYEHYYLIDRGML